MGLFSRTELQVTILASLAFFTVGLNLLAYGAIQQPVMAELGLSVTESGMLVSSWFISYSLMQIPGGYLSDRIGGEATIAVFAAVTGLASLGLGLVTGFAGAVALRVVLGFGCGALLPASVKSLSSRMHGHQLEVANGLFGAGWGVAQIVVLNLLPFVTVLSSWRGSLMVAGVITLGVAAYAAALSRLLKYSRPGGGAPVRARGSLTPKMVMLMLVNMTGIVVPVFAITWAPVQFQQVFGLSAADASRVVSVFGVLTVVSSVVGGVAARALGAKRVMVVSMLLTLVGVLVLANPPNLFVGLVLMGVLGFAAMFYVSPNFSMVPDSAPAGKENPGFVFGVFNTLSNGIALFPPLAAAYVLDVTRSFQSAFLVIAVVAAVGMLSALLVRQ